MRVPAARGAMKRITFVLLSAFLLSAGFGLVAGSAPPASVVGGAFEVGVPVPIVLVGFPAGYGGTLSGHLDASAVRHAYLSTTPEERGPETLNVEKANEVAFLTHRFVPIPNYTIHVLSSTETTGFFADLASLGEVQPGLYSAAVAEDLLADALARDGLAPRAEAPTLVLVNGASHISGAYAYRQAYPGKDLDGVRAFGEREPLLVFDLSAGAAPLNATAADAPTVAARVRDAVEFRLLQGPLFPATTHRCHGVTIIGITRLGSPTYPPLAPSGWDTLDAARLNASFQSLVGDEPVHVDLKLLRLPVDDPALHAVFATGQYDLIHLYLTTRWADYWVPHAGCEAYLSFLIDGSLTDHRYGFASWDVDSDRRISLSVLAVEELHCVTMRPPPPVRCVYGPGGAEWGLHLVAHETGHLFGARHPHDVSLVGGASRLSSAFTAVHTAMSYSAGAGMAELSAIDANNWARNRLATFLEEAGPAASDPVAMAPVLAALDAQDWQGAADLLDALTP